MVSEYMVNISFSDKAEKKVKKVCITALKLDENATKDTAGAPSLVLRCLGKQESAWDLAKKYNTTIFEILTANHLEDETLPKNQLLLIPRKRG